MPGPTVPPDLDTPTVADRLLDATLEVAAVHGISRLSVGDVAKRAGLSRQTLYKHFASRDDLVGRAVMREAGRIVEEVIAASSGHADPAASLEAAILEALRLVRNHPLLDRLIATEPEALLPLLIDGQGSVLGAMRDVAEQMVLESRPDLAPTAARAAADLLSRMLVSYAVRPPEAPHEVVARFLAAAVIGALPPAPA